MKRHVLAGLCVAALAMRAAGSGMLIPKDQELPPLAIESQRVDIQIKDGVATARIEQVFRNSVARDLEAVYLFPLPENASISDFAMYIGGKRVSGELVEKDKARRTYEDIVRRMKDPGLLEHMGGNLFRVSVFPVPANGTQKIELEYSQALTFESGLYRYVYPLKTGDKASRTLADFTVAVRLSSKLPLKTVYSPSHAVGVTRKGDHEAVIGFEQDRALLDRDFEVYYGVSKKDFGVNLLANAAGGDKGYYLLMIAPAVTPPDEKAMAKDVVFVFDSSGSMAGKKIEQARRALEYCVNKLGDGDRFNILRFSTDVEPLNETLVAAGGENRDKALAFIRKIEAQGGTAIDAALAAALKMNYDPKRPAILLFLTDGKPTVGEIDPEAIVTHAAKANESKVRMFVFGVDEQLNTRLLDKLSGQNGGVSQYVAPQEDIEVKVSSLADKMSHPVLSKVKVSVDKIKTSFVHPSELPDLFSGEQITVLGRYEGQGDAAIRLTGEVNGKPREFVYEGTFPSETAENGFIPRLWATRRVGYLLDEIRLHGEEKELKEEVVRLSREHGIMTPYTSYLVLENEQAYSQHGIDSRRPAAPPSSRVFAKATKPDAALTGRGFSGGGAPSTVTAAAPAEDKAAAGAVPMFDDRADAARDYAVSRESGAARATVRRESQEGVNSYLKSESGTDAVKLSEAIRGYKEREVNGEDIATVRHVGRKVFYLIDGRWIDRDFKDGMKVVKVTFGSDEYFKWIADKPALKPFLALGGKVTVVLDDGSALIVE